MCLTDKTDTENQLAQKPQGCYIAGLISTIVCFQVSEHSRPLQMSNK